MPAAAFAQVLSSFFTLHIVNWFSVVAALQACVQPRQIEFILQIGFGRNQYCTVILQKAQDAVQGCNVVTQSVKALHHDGVDAPLPHGGEHGEQIRSPELGAVLLLHAGVDDDVTTPAGFMHDFCKLFFQCGQVRRGTAGERPNFVFFHGRTSELIHKWETDIKAGLAKGGPREAVADKAFQPTVDEFGVQITFSGNKVDIILTQSFNNSHQYVAVAADLFQVAHHHGFNSTVFYCVQHRAQTDAVFQGIAAAMVKRCAAYKESMPCCFVDKVIQPVKGNARIAVGAAHINPDIVVSHKVHLRFLFSQKVIRALLLPDELLHIFNFLGGWTSRQRCQRGVMVLAADARALVQNRHHAGILLGTDGTSKALPELLLHFGDNFGVYVVAQIRVLPALIVADRVWYRERQLCDNQQ